MASTAFDSNATTPIDEVFFDPTDDYSDDEVIDPGHFLKTNEEIFTDKYMQDFAAKIARERRMDKCISAGVILGCIFTVVLFCLYAYWRYMC